MLYPFDTDRILTSVSLSGAAALLVDLPRGSGVFDGFLALTGDLDLDLDGVLALDYFAGDFDTDFFASFLVYLPFTG